MVLVVGLPGSFWLPLMRAWEGLPSVPGFGAEPRPPEAHKPSHL